MVAAQCYDTAMTDQEGASRSRRSPSRRLTPYDVQARKGTGEPLVLVTAYDFPTARLAEAAGVDAILVGDTLGHVVLGHLTTIPVTLEAMVHHLQAVRRGARRTLVIGDMPFLTFRTGIEDAVRHAGRLMQEGNAQAVKLEGGRPVAATIGALVEAGIPVMGHIGLTPQSYYQLGGNRIQGRTPTAARALLDDALALEEAGCFSIVLEGLPTEVAAAITERVGVPTIGIAAGPDCDGQVQVLHDLLGFTAGRRTKRHARRYVHLDALVEEALGAYAADVRSRKFPGAAESFPADEQTLAGLADWEAPGAGTDEAAPPGSGT